jgi:multidrug efflux pump subunit AcrA (membrane-fusion protein)
MMLKMPRRLWSALLVKAALLGTLALYALAPRAHAAENLEYNGKLYCPVEYTLHVEYPGVVEEVLATPGDRVREGQVLARYRLKPDAALSILGYLDRERIRATESTLMNSTISILEQEEEYAAARRLSSVQMGSAERLGRLRKTLNLTRQQKVLTENKLKDDKESFRLRQAVIKEKLGVAVEEDATPEFGELLSPKAGEVLLMDPSLREGMVLHGPLMYAVTLAGTNPMEVRTQVYEAEIPSLRLDGKAEVKVMSLDERVYEGRITFIDHSPGAIAVETPSYYTVRLEIPNDDGALRPGFKVVVRFVQDKEGS